MHGSVIIRSRYRAEFKFPVIAAFRPSFFVYNHRTYGFKSINIRNIIGLHTIKPFHAKQLLNLFYRADGTSFFSLNLFFILAENQLCIFRSQLHQLFFESFLRNPYRHFPPAFGTQPFFQHRNVFDCFLEHDFPRDKRRPRIILFHKIYQNIPCAFF